VTPVITIPGLSFTWKPGREAGLAGQR
jgi:hypothetical protein